MFQKFWKAYFLIFSEVTFTKRKRVILTFCSAVRNYRGAGRKAIKMIKKAHLSGAQIYAHKKASFFYRKEQ